MRAITLQIMRGVRTAAPAVPITVGGCRTMLAEHVNMATVEATARWWRPRRLHSLRIVLDARYTPRLACKADIQDVHIRKLVPGLARAKERRYRLEYALHRAVRARDRRGAAEVPRGRV